MAAGGPSAGRGTSPAGGACEPGRRPPARGGVRETDACETGRVVVIRPKGRMGITALSADGESETL